MRAAIEFVSKVSGVESPVLLLGPSGSGKEVLARSIHEEGARESAQFVAINCASLNEQLMEAELFGYEKGAFTGAVSSQPGKFEVASGGTLFLDEIGELSSSLQAKLLRVIQEREFYRVGGLKQIKTNARIIAATHRSLSEMVTAGTFREDLYFRLNVLTFALSPLSDRSEDIPILLDHFWKRFRDCYGCKAELAPETRAALLNYRYPGNVREMQNILERLAVLYGKSDPIPPSYLPPEVQRAGQEPPSEFVERRAEYQGKGLMEKLEAIESKLVFLAMEQARQNQIRAAQLLKISRGALQYKLKKYGYRIPEKVYSLAHAV